jgi:hypothetical protein
VSSSGKELVRLADSILWELRRFWASGKRVSLTLADEAGQRIEGHVTHVTATGAFVRVNGLHIRTEDILAVHSPCVWEGDSSWRSGQWHGNSRRWLPQREELPGIEQ